MNSTPSAQGAFGWRAIGEVAGVGVTGVLHLVWPSHVLGPHVVYIAGAFVAWAAYVTFRIRQDRSILQRWGFRLGGLRQTCLAAGGGTAVGAIGLAAFGIVVGTFRLHWHMLPLLALYPLWGLLQQFIVQAFVAGNLAAAPRPIGSMWLVTILTASLFCLAHVHDWELVVGTFAMGLVFTPIYLRWHNLWPLGVCHGWLGVLIYFWVLNVDPWVTTFGGGSATLTP